MATAPFKTVVMMPLTGPLDSRSNPEDVPPLSFRFKLNFAVNDNDKLARAPGWERLLTEQVPYVNQDAHDQGDCFDIAPVREPFTFLYEAGTQDGIRRLMRGNRSTLAFLSEATGNWTTVARGFGGLGANNQVRWSAGQVGNRIIFTNGVDKPQSYNIGNVPAVCGDNAVAEIADLNILKVTRAGVAASFSGCAFLMDVIQDGVRYPSRVRWSGVNKPLTWVSGVDTVANFQDLPYGETILAAKELQQNLIIFTDKSIYRCYVSGTSFGFTRVYTEPLNRDKCLVYPQTLVSDGNSLWYRSRNEFYRWDVYLSEPEEVEWLWRCNNLVSETLDPTCCNGPVGWYWPERKTIMWSWPQPGGDCLNFRTLEANLRVKTAHIIDKGFTAGCNYRSDQRQTIEEWLDEFCTTDFIGLCTEIGSRSVEDFCSECNQSQLLVLADADDLCLKQYATAFSRELCTNSAIGEGSFDGNGDYEPFVGEYERLGYFSVLRGMFPLAFVDREKSIKQFLMEPTVQELLGLSNYWRLRVGTSYQARDANPAGNPLAFAYDSDDMAPAYEAEFATDGGTCEVLWHRMSDKPVQCPDTMTTAEYLARNIRPVKSVNWVFLEQGRFLYYELAVISKNELQQVVPPVGADFTLSRFTVDARVLQV